MIWWAFEKAALSERRAGTTTCPKQVAARALQWRAFWKEAERRCEAEEGRRCEVDSLWWVEEGRRCEVDSLWWVEEGRRCEVDLSQTAEAKRCEVDSLWWVEEAKRREADCQHSDRTERRWRRRTVECLRA